MAAIASSATVAIAVRPSRIDVVTEECGLGAGASCFTG